LLLLLRPTALSLIHTPSPYTITLLAMEPDKTLADTIMDLDHYRFYKALGPLSGPHLMTTDYEEAGKTAMMGAFLFVLDDEDLGDRLVVARCALARVLVGVRNTPSDSFLLADPWGVEQQFRQLCLKLSAEQIRVFINGGPRRSIPSSSWTPLEQSRAWGST
jgi:hypothetical protein